MNNNKKNKNKKMSREEYLYHNTELLLKKYRDVVWGIEASVIQAQMNFELEMNCSLNEFLDLSYMAGADLSGTQIEEQMRTLERNKKMLKIIESAINLLRNKSVDGEVYYWILYYTYLCEKPCKKVEDKIMLIEKKTDFMSRKTYFNKRHEAVKILSSILWGYTSPECISLMKEFI